MNRETNNGMKEVIPVAILFGFLFLMFPGRNPGIDALSYAAALRHGGLLFHPHHLLYNPFQFGVLTLIESTGLKPDILSLTMAVNAICAMTILFITGKILLRLDSGKPLAIAGVVFAGSCFSLMRYATENEAYLFPLLFGLAGSLSYIKFRITGKNLHVLLSGLGVSLSVLFHQIGLFWWLGIFIWILSTPPRKKALALYLVPGLLIPLFYILAWKTEGAQTTAGNLIEFALYSYSTGDANVSLSFNAILLGVINLARSFLQVHGNILFFPRENLLYLLPAAGFAAGLLVAFLQRKKRFVRKEEPSRGIAAVHLLVASALWIFAVLSQGNAEFMVMIPPLLLIAGISLFHIRPSFLLALASGILAWNVGYGILPAHLYRYEPVTDLAERVIGNPSNLYILKEDQRVQAACYYLSGKEFMENLSRPPSGYERRGIPADSLHRRIMETNRSEGFVLTDCVGRPEVFSRSSFFDDNDRDFFNGYLLVPEEQLSAFYGKTVIHRVLPKGE